MRLSRADLRRRRGLLQTVDERTPATLMARGNLELLQRRLLGFYCSVAVPEEMKVSIHALQRSLAKSGCAVVGPFHSPVEREFLTLLLQTASPVIVFPGRAVAPMQLQPAWKAAIQQERLLLLSPFEGKVKRVTRETAILRNRVAAALADDLFVVYASPGGKIEDLCREVVAWQKPLYTLDSPFNAALIKLGARPLRAESAAQQLAVMRVGR